jgi:hypothetical protein
MRALIFIRSPDGPYVMAETVDDWVAEDLSEKYREAFYCDRAEALEDPELRAAVLAWEADDDRRAAAARALDESLMALQEAEDEVMAEGTAPGRFDAEN